MAVEAECTECGQPVEATVSDGPVQVQMDSARVTAGDVEGVWDEEGPEGVADWIRLMASVARASSTSSSTPAGVDVRDVSGLADRFRELGLHAAVALLDDCPAVETARPSGGVGQPNTAEPRPSRRRIGGLGEPDPDGSEDNWDDTSAALIEAALGLICNVDDCGQGWRQSDEWVEAADRWLARYGRVHRADRSPRSWSLPAPPPPDDVTVVHVGDRVRVKSTGRTGVLREIDSRGRHLIFGDNESWITGVRADNLEPAPEPPRFERGFYRLARDLDLGRPVKETVPAGTQVAVTRVGGEDCSLWYPGGSGSTWSVPLADLTAAGAVRVEGER